MARGDVVIGKITSAGSFQPATGIEVAITSVSNNHINSTALWAYYDTAVIGYFAHVFAAAATLAKESTVKVFINNTIFLYVDSSGTYSGVQIK